jgi:hypothetical protein
VTYIEKFRFSNFENYYMSCVQKNIFSFLLLKADQRQMLVSFMTEHKQKLNTSEKILDFFPPDFDLILTVGSASGGGGGCGPTTFA